MPSLTTLRLNSEGSPQIEGEELEVITESLSSLIKTITLNFDR